MITPPGLQLPCCMGRLKSTVSTPPWLKPVPLLKPAFLTLPNFAPLCAHVLASCCTPGIGIGVVADSTLHYVAQLCDHCVRTVLEWPGMVWPRRTVKRQFLRPEIPAFILHFLPRLAASPCCMQTCALGNTVCPCEA